MRTHRVRSGEVTLAVREYGERGAPTLVAVHGYPDDQELWRPFVDHVLPRMRVVTYDVRGAGASSRPRDVAAYRLERLVDDLVAVLDTVVPDEPVHLLGHDWGSVQLWDAVNAEQRDARLTGRLASYTSVSGPCLDHVAAFARTGTWWARLDQMAHSWYVYAFHVPVAPDLMLWPAGAPLLGRRRARDAATGLALYRANIRSRVGRARSVRARVPVQLVVARRDAFVRPATLAVVPQHVDVFRRVELDCGHWVPRQRPAELADLVTDWALSR